VEGAAGLIILTGLFQRDAPTDDIYNVNPVEQVIDELWRYFTSHRAGSNGLCGV
jgi:hypothetical protein